MNKIWLLADSHFGHKKMPEYCGRPVNFEELLFTNIRENVFPGDTIIHLGDFCIGNDKEWMERYCNALVGVNKILILGNHDKQSVGWYLKSGFDFVCEQVSGHYYGKYVTFSHRPIPGIQNINVHGHTHGNILKDPECNKFYNKKLHIEMALENTEYSPILLESILNQHVNRKRHYKIKHQIA